MAFNSINCLIRVEKCGVGVGFSKFATRIFHVLNIITSEVCNA